MAPVLSYCEDGHDGYGGLSQEGSGNSCLLRPCRMVAALVVGPRFVFPWGGLAPGTASVTAMDGVIPNAGNRDKRRTMPKKMAGPSGPANNKKKPREIGPSAAAPDQLQASDGATSATVDDTGFAAGAQSHLDNVVLGLSSRLSS